MTATKANPIQCSVPFETDGVHHGHLGLPHSHDESAWGSILIPITVVRNGDGPTVLFTGGNHGDEYEGPIALFDLAHALKADEIRGRVVIVPALNYPAFEARTRASPFDKGNLNRLFPGRPDGTPTEKIADYVTRHLLPLADVVVDIHSGGRTLTFLPFACCHELDDKEQEARCEAAMLAFGAPYSVKLREIDAGGMLDTTAEAMGKTFVSTEIYGGGTATPWSVSIAKRGIQGILHHAGLIAEPIPDHPTVRLVMPDGDCYIPSQDSGLVEFVRALGDPVEPGETVALIHDVTRIGMSPIPYQAKRSGIMIGRHYPGMIKQGDIVAVLADIAT